MFVQLIPAVSLVTAFALSATWCGIAQAAEPHDELRTTLQTLPFDHAPRTFLTPLAQSPHLSPQDPRLLEACRFNQSPEQCLHSLRYGNSSGGRSPVVPPSVTTNLPHLHVMFTLQDLANTLVAGNGIGGDGETVDLRFEVDSSVSSSEWPTVFVGLAVGWLDPGVSNPYYSILWQSVILNGCVDPPPVIPVHFKNSISVLSGGMPTEVEAVGLFEADDNTSLVPTGFWNFEYTVHASDSEGDASDIRVRGKASVVCSARDEA
jgi:hypothetical protein